LDTIVSGGGDDTGSVHKECLIEAASIGMIQFDHDPSLECYQSDSVLCYSMIGFYWVWIAFFKSLSVIYKAVASFSLSCSSFAI